MYNIVFINKGSPPDCPADPPHSGKRSMRRGKPQLPIYRPGSGPLRKSTPGPEETESDSNLVVGARQARGSSQGKFRSEGSSPKDMDRVGDSNARRPRKPEQALYVPRPLQKHEGGFQQVNGNYEGRSKRYSNRRRDGDEDRRVPSPMYRGPRQGSESRAHPGNSNWNKMRDTKSVEPNLVANRNYNGEKVHAKPPSGRRHSTIGMENEKKMKIPNLELLPPRFRKKLVLPLTLQSG